MGINLRWGNYNAYMEAVRCIIKQPNEFYKALAQGVEQAASQYGGADFALSFGGNEMPGYHTGPGAHLGVLIGSRHSHLDNAGYSIDQKILLTKRISSEELAKVLLDEERWRQILSSLVICFFARGIFTPDIVSKTLQVVGFDFQPEDLHKIGEEIHREKYRFKIREGFSLDTLRAPKRIFETPSPVGNFGEKFILDAIAYVKKELLLE